MLRDITNNTPKNVTPLKHIATIITKHEPTWRRYVLFLILLCLPLTLSAQTNGTSSPFDTGFANLQALFTGTIAKVTSLIAIVLGGLGFATGDPGAKRNLAGVAVGIGIAVLAVNILTWLWGV